MDKLDEMEIDVHLNRLTDWQLDGDGISKDFKFADFSAAMEFINKLAVRAEELNHHPVWSNSYNKVSVSLSSHEAGGLTEADFQLAEAADKAASD